jgi:hypothetical protein
VLAVLRVAVTRPRALPPRLRRGVVFWVATWVLAVLVISPLAVIRNDLRERREVQVVAAPSPSGVEMFFDVPTFVDSPVNVHFRTEEPPRVPICLAVRFVRDAEQWQTVGQLSPTRRLRYTKVRGMGPGRYRVTVRAAAIEPVPATVQIYTWGNLSVGWLIATLNLLLYLMLLELVRSPFDRPAPWRRRIARSGIILWLLFMLTIGLFRWNPMPPSSRPEAPRPMACGQP